ncbi:MAG: translation initiation factor IF-2 [Elusimicrobia bacterium]|nr:translation initiation factor IF-2 [Elusimicrobiota bacterium]
MTDKKTTTKKPAAKKAAPKKPSAKKDPKKSGETTVISTKAEVRTREEEGSIAPASTRLVDPFALHRSSQKRRTMTGTPTVARLAPGASLPRPPEPVKPDPVPTPAPVPAPVANAPAAPAAPVPAAPAAAPVPAAPAAPAPAAPTAPAAKAPAAPEPKATYTLPTEAPRPAIPQRMMPPGARMGPKPVVKHPAKAAPKPAETAPASAPNASAPAALKPLTVSTMVTVRELGEKMNVPVTELIKKLMIAGVFATINQRLDSETAVIIAADFGWELVVTPLHMEEEIITAKGTDDSPEHLRPRSPVVTVMGHVDHGKTSLLDAIRDADVAAGEAGGITQHIGAYQVKVAKGTVTFLDTPGHEAFTAMRSRGAKVTDIVILVVSATDGVMPQTVEAMDHAKEAKVPIIVAVNKIDLPGANTQKIRQDLAAKGLSPEEWGGKTIFVDLSAKKRINIDKLLEMVLLQAELLELKANPDRPAVGTVVEAKMDKQRGAVATVLIQKGTVKIGDPFVMGLSGGKVKALINDKGERILSAGPSQAVEILGLTGSIAQAGDTFNAVENERMSREIIDKRNRVFREEALAHKHHVSLVNIKDLRAKELPLIIKADVSGSVEVLKDSLEKLSTAEISVRVIHAGLGNVNESDVLLATASNAIVLMFHVDIDARAKETADKNGIEVRPYQIIYDLTADVKASLEGLLEPETVDIVIGKVEMRQEFKMKGGRIAGCQVVDGKAVRGSKVKVMRGNQLVGEGRLESLKRFKDDAREVEKGLECGCVIPDVAWAVGDVFEVVVQEKRVRRLTPNA